jgi:LysM repeat protein
MATTRFSSTLGRRSILARIAAVLALAACGVAIYLVVMSFTESETDGDSKNDKKGRSEQSKDNKEASVNSYTVAAGDTLSAIAIQTGSPEPRIERLNPDIDSETLNAGQILALR